MATAFETRRVNLRQLILDKFDGNRAAFSRAAGVHQNQVNLILTDNPDHRRNLGEALARKMEAALGVGPGFFDVPSANSPGGKVTAVKSGPPPEGLEAILIRDDMHAGTLLYDSFLEQLARKMTEKANLQLFRVGVKDMEPELMYGDYVLVDLGVKAVMSDGVYILGHGNDMFLRRVKKQLTGGWVISTPGGDPIKVGTLKSLRVVTRIMMVSRHVVM